MTGIPFVTEFDFSYGIADQLSPRVRRVIANKPGSFTFTGTGTYIIGRGEVAIIDPGPADEAHIEALLTATAGETITHVLVTHTHTDHSPGCKLLLRHCDAETWSFGAHGEGGRKPVAHNAAAHDAQFGADTEFEPDHRLIDGQTLAGGAGGETGWTLQCIHTPGHAANHAGFYLSEENALFCGDAVMGWSTTIVSPPDGNMKDYMATLALLHSRNDRIYYPSHGAPVENPQTFVAALQAHRIERENQILQCVENGYSTIMAMVPQVYSELDSSLYPAAARSLFATVECLAEQGRLHTDGGITFDSRYRLAR